MLTTHMQLAGDRWGHAERLWRHDPINGASVRHDEMDSSYSAERARLSSLLTDLTG